MTLATSRSRLLPVLFGLALSFTAVAAPTDIHNEPLAQAMSAAKANLMFVLDDSGSMAWDFLPDYVTSTGTTYRNCRRGADGNGNLGSALVDCEFGDVPYNSADFNFQYYNPTIYYRPSPAPGGLYVDSRNMTAANTSNWTQVSPNAYTGASPDNLVSEYQDRVWCVASSSDVNNPSVCKASADHTYPTATFKYPKTRYGAPYYYRVSIPQYCTDSTFRNCQATMDATHTVPAAVRFCTDSSETSCQAKRAGSFTYPSFAGRYTPSGVVALPATATITVANSNSNTSVSVAAIYVNGVNILNNTVTASGGTNTSTERDSAATAIRNAINAGTATHGFSATVSGSVVTVYSPIGAGDAYNGIPLQPAFAAAAARASTTFSVVSVNGSNVSRRSVSSLQVGGVNIINASIELNNGNTATSATKLADAINSYNNGAPWEYTATVSGSVITVYAPLDMGAVPNGLALTYAKGSGVSLSPGSGSAVMSGGAGAANLPVNVTSFTGGRDDTVVWVSDIHFERINIVPTVAGVPQTFPRGSARVDCASSTHCTYDEEMTNFANWYAYYRTRLQAAKSATGRAFAPIGDEVRVGFITINPGSTVSSNRYLRINEFDYNSGTDSGHKKTWYEKLYGITTNGSTPLREALSRVGRLYAGKFDDINTGIPAADDPVQYSCQPNFAILTTDGYWNGNGGKNISGGGGIGNEDNVDSGYSKRVDGVYDGGGSSASGTLADVALYYYKNDLRTGMANNVFTTTKDSARHQHMTTFTVGLGLSGELDFIPNYESADSGDFYAIRQGTKDWPVPVAERQSALDDLWHAAVNGRGTFYSARNPQDFANGLADALLQMNSRNGAGAAASVSNLQPSPGDNFVFTAQYQTATWTGDVLARTLDTSNGDISQAAPLWSAKTLLNGRNFADRKIFTLDSSDTAGNKLKHFCWPGDGGANCGDGGGLSPTEQAYFDPDQLPQYNGWTVQQTTTATPTSLVNYLRGDRANETTGNTNPTDLYRARFSVLGDVIHGQPAYVKASPFEYTNGNIDYPGSDNPYYPEFKTSTKQSGGGRLGTVYVAANDGMLHAFETDVNRDPYYQTAGIGTVTENDDTYTGNNIGNGEERWAYIPAILMPSLHKLADTPYTHRYFADGSPVVGDICVGHTTATPCTGIDKWKTILVAGLNSGGRGFYALDVTDPIAPKGLWEFAVSNTCLTDAEANSGLYSSDCNIGLSFSEPLIVKRPLDDRWVVMVSSGYNNFNPGDGKGYLYILDAVTGKILQRIGTGVGGGGTGPTYADATPSGFGKINGWAERPMLNNLALAVYGGDLNGNLWRIDLTPELGNGDPNPQYAQAFKLAALRDSLGNAQPITVRPELGKAGYNRIILLGTGRYLGTIDPPTTSQQTIYAIRDDKSATPVAVRGDLLARTFTPDPLDPTNDAKRVSSGVAIDWATHKGWYIDLPDSGERVNVDPVYQAGVLVVASNVPDDDVCLGGGYSWLNYFRLNGTGVSKKLGTSIAVGVTYVKLGDKSVIQVQDSSGNIYKDISNLIEIPGVTGNRVSWREWISE
jgi:type IV pilus assembly protein PilY1